MLDTLKSDTVLLDPIRQHIISGRSWDRPRSSNWIHVSELSKSDLCLRAVYYRIAGYKAVKDSDTSYVLETIYQEGHEAHRKYQNWLWEMGLLEGVWKCLLPQCKHRWWGMAPSVCPECGSDLIDYDEVPVRSDEHLLEGHADLKVGDVVGEIKTLAKGTVRIEAPTIYEKHKHRLHINGREREILDLEGMWSDINRPFPSHLKQGHLYGYLLGLPRVVFIYECKWNQMTKEFVVRTSERVVEPLLEKCLNIKYALERQRPPACPKDGCAACEIYGEHPDAPTESQGGRNRAAVGGDPQGESRAGEERFRSSTKAALSRPRAADPDSGSGRPGADELLRPTGPLDRLLRRASGAPQR